MTRIISNHFRNPAMIITSKKILIQSNFTFFDTMISRIKGNNTINNLNKLFAIILVLSKIEKSWKVSSCIEDIFLDVQLLIISDLLNDVVENGISVSVFKRLSQDNCFSTFVSEFKYTCAVGIQNPANTGEENKNNVVIIRIILNFINFYLKDTRCSFLFCFI